MRILIAEDSLNPGCRSAQAVWEAMGHDVVVTANWGPRPWSHLSDPRAEAGS